MRWLKAFGLNLAFFIAAILSLDLRASPLSQNSGGPGKGIVQKCLSLLSKIPPLFFEKKIKPEIDLSEPKPSVLDRERESLMTLIQKNDRDAVIYALKRLEWRTALGTEFVNRLEIDIFNFYITESYKNLFPPDRTIIARIPDPGDIARTLIQETNGIEKSLKFLDKENLSPEQFSKRLLAILKARMLQARILQTGTLERTYKEDWEALENHQKLILLEAGFNEDQITTLRQKTILVTDIVFRDRRAATLENENLQRAREILQKRRTEMINQANEAMQEKRIKSRAARARSVEQELLNRYGQKAVADVSRLLSKFIQIDYEHTVILDQMAEQRLSLDDQILFQWFPPELSKLILSTHEEFRELPEPEYTDKMHRYLYDFLKKHYGTNRVSPYPDRSFQGAQGGFILAIPKPL